MSEKRFPVMASGVGSFRPVSRPTLETVHMYRGTISWALAERAYQDYDRRYSGQSLERLAERGGFSHSELLRHGLTVEEVFADFRPPGQ